MNKKIIGVVLVVLIAAVGGWLWHEKTETSPLIKGLTAAYKDATYTINGKSLTLVNGSAESPAAPGSFSEMQTKYFGNEAIGDLNGDGVPDVVFLLTQSGGGSGTFYYAVAAVKILDGYMGTNAVLLGDRVAPQSTTIADGKVTVNFADRNASEPMTAQPSVGKSLVLVLNPATLQLSEAVSKGGEVGKRCGGNMRGAYVCATGYHCAPAPGSHLPFGDVGGTCAAN